MRHYGTPNNQNNHSAYKYDGLLMVNKFSETKIKGLPTIYNIYIYIYNFSVNKDYVEIKIENKEKSLKKRKTSGMKQQQYYIKT